jgi:hypothetical protein
VPAAPPAEGDAVLFQWSGGTTGSEPVPAVVTRVVGGERSLVDLEFTREKKKFAARAVPYDWRGTPNTWRRTP